jgi:4-hydroxy-tetrahydrodipicolinate synthase
MITEMTNPRFGRVLTAMVTPFDVEGNVDYTVAGQLAAHLVANGSDGLVVCGTTGESPTLSLEEKLQLFTVVKQSVGDKAKVIAGTGGNCTESALELTQKTAKLGVDASLQVVPYYNKPPQEGLYQHFQAIAQACPDLPMMLYNVPGRTSQSLEAKTVAKLAKIDNIVAIKEASASVEQTCKIRLLTPATFEIYSGDDFMTLPLMTVGCIGVVSVASHLVGKQMQEMIQAFITGENAVATEIQLQLFPLFKALFSTTNPIAVKAALKTQGWAVGGLRPPLCEMPSELQSNLEAVLKDLSLI